jgi:hypothetical protein
MNLYSYVHLIIANEPEPYDEEKIAYSTNVAWKSGSLHVEN